MGSGTALTDLQIDANAIWRGVGGNGGSDYGINASGAGGWLVDRIWTRHVDANWLSGTNGIIQNSRTADTYGDGFNVNADLQRPGQPQPAWDRLMAKRRRKTLVVCAGCHAAIHSGQPTATLTQ